MVLRPGVLSGGSMAATQLYSSGLAAKRSLPSMERLQLPIVRSRVSSSSFLELRNNNCFRKFSVNLCLNESSRSGVVVNTATKSAEGISGQSDESVELKAQVEPVDENTNFDMDVQEEDVVQPGRSSKIHDFCLGIPYGGIVFAGGLLGFIFSRNLSSLTTSGLLGGAILFLSVFSLKVWRSGRSSLPFILGQAVIAATLLRKHLVSYSLTKKIFPTGFYIFLSASMICFYSYVLLAGGNPAPKNKAAAASVS